jgi:hypothetical protein
LSEEKEAKKQESEAKILTAKAEAAVADAHKRLE